MHHPEIGQIILVLDDYFILSGVERKTAEIKVLKKISNDRLCSCGILIKQPLFNGYLEIYITSPKEDGNEITFNYFDNSNNLNEPQWTKEVGCGNYAENIRDVYREILIIDRDTDTVLSPT
jgi:hypothetical protein